MGRRAGKIALSILGGIVIYLSIMYPFGFIGLPNLSTMWQRTLSNDALIDRVIESRSLTRAEWNEITGRPLTTQQTQRLAEYLIEHELKNRWLFEVPTWLDAQAKAGLISQQTIHRWIERRLEAQIKMPERVVLGKSFSLSLQLDMASAVYAFPPAPDVFVYVGGFYFGSSQQPIGRVDHEYPASGLLYWLDELSGSHTPDQPGPLTIRFVHWIITRAPRNTNQLDPIQWQDDGSPLLPPDTTWSKRIEIKKTITVTPTP